jgi:hypothetical protein
VVIIWPKKLIKTINLFQNLLTEKVILPISFSSGKGVSDLKARLDFCIKILDKSNE